MTLGGSKIIEAARLRGCEAARLRGCEAAVLEGRARKLNGTQTKKAAGKPTALFGADQQAGHCISYD
ncbi:hypothetical protein C1M53_03070 [Mesorhizobium sp. Pch-S]|nr:hypothetical protein C1M53_03070 [Mesorhizobium sp. Pch-S]